MQVDVATLAEGVVIVVVGLYALFAFIAMGMDTYGEMVLRVLMVIVQIAVISALLFGGGWLVNDFIGRVA